MTSKDKTLVTELKKILLDKFGEVITGIYCFGSRISKNKLDADFDILVITARKVNWEEELQISKTIVHFGIGNDIVFGIQFMSEDEFEIQLKYHPFVQSVKA